MRFLVVDDSSTMRRIVVNSLQRLGLKDVVEAEDGVDAMTKFNSRVGCVITDWNMPTMTGLELTVAIRAHPEGSTVPILMVTARSTREDIIAALNAGVQNYIVKPFTPDLLREKLEAILPAGSVP
jgi:two-component system, chemotaxis family, chemotaxis protein CheY